MADFEANFVLGQQTEVTANFSVEVANNDHAILVNRDLSDQHPISAITGLQEALDEIPEDYVSDAELESALLEKQDVISDLAQIRSGALLGSTAVQPNELLSYATEEYVDSELESKQDVLTPTQMQAVNSGANTTNIGQISTNTADIADIDALIPNQASTSNQLADKDFVNSSIATNTANFIGTFNSVAELEAYSGTLTNNDYAFISTTDTAGNTLYDRYKWNGSEWLFEYELNNSSFTAVQWAAINSGATTTNIRQIATNTGDISSLQTGKQDVISDLSTIRSGAALGATSVQPSDLSTYVTTNTDQSINGLKTIKNQLKVQSGSGDGSLFIGADANSTTLSNGVRKLARVNMPTHEDITLPMTIISGDTTGDIGSTIGQKAGICNRIEFGGRPGAKYNTSPDGMAFCVAKSHNSTLDKVIALEMDATQARFNVQPKYNGANLSTKSYVDTGLATKQATLVSGTNIKTINNQSILGSGNIDIQGGTDIEAFTAAEVQTIWNGVL